MLLMYVPHRLSNEVRKRLVWIDAPSIGSLLILSVPPHRMSVPPHRIGITDCRCNHGSDIFQSGGNMV
jgi:hypothetical protein